MLRSPHERNKEKLVPKSAFASSAGHLLLSLCHRYSHFSFLNQENSIHYYTNKVYTKNKFPNTLSICSSSTRAMTNKRKQAQREWIQTDPILHLLTNPIQFSTPKRTFLHCSNSDFVRGVWVFVFMCVCVCLVSSVLLITFI